MMSVIIQFSDQEVLEKLKQNDISVFKKIYKYYWYKLYVVAYKRVRNRESSEEIVRNIFTKLWINRYYPAAGDKKPWPGFAEDFNVPGFVDKVRAMGGKYIVWSATWSNYLFSAPIKAIAEVLPGRVSKRDLIGDLIRESKKYNIKVTLYNHMGHDHKDVLLAKDWKDGNEEDYNSREV